MIYRLEFSVPGKAAPQGSKKHVGRGILVESCKEVGPWRERIAIVAHNGMTEAEFHLAVRGTPVMVDVLFVLPRPSSTPKTKTPPAVKRPDGDKLGRAVLDALTGVCFEDDSQVTVMTFKKRLAELGENPVADISVVWDT